MGGVYNCVNGNLYHYAGNNPVKYIDPDGKTATGAVLGWIGTDIGVPEPTDAIPWKWVGYGVAILAAVGIDYVATKIVASVGEKTKNNDEVTMYHYSETPPSEFKGALRPNSYITPDKYANGVDAREKLAIPKNDDGSEKSIRYRYSVKVKPGDFRAAENSIPGTNTVAELDGKSGGGTEFKTNVPLIPYKCEVIPE